MKKFVYFVTAGLMALSLTACSGGTKGENDNTPTPTQNPDPIMTDKSNVNDNRESDIEPSDYEFKLTEEEELVYNEYLKELNTDLFVGLSPISVAKIFVQTGIDGEWEAEYEIFASETVTMTKEEWKEQHERDVAERPIASRYDFATWIFPFIDEGEVIEEGNKATIIFKSVPSTSIEAELNPDSKEEEELKSLTYNMFLIKNEKGIWEMDFDYMTTINDEE